MSLLSKSYTFSAGATIVASEHNSNFDTLYNGVNGNLDNINLKANAAIVDTKLAQITTAAKVSGTALTLLPNTPSGAGVLPVANISPFATFPVTPSSAPTTDYQVANKKYVDSLGPSYFTVFAGDGSDGAGPTTTGDISNTVKQYSTWNIPVGQTITAQNCLIGVSGTLTIAGVLSADSGGLAANTSIGVDFQSIVSGGGGGGGGNGSTGTGTIGGTAGGAGGAGGTSPVAGSAASAAKCLFVKNSFIPISILKGAGGGDGSGTGYGEGGVGGGVLIIECNELVFTGTAHAAGGAGVGYHSGNAGGGGGGGGGTVIIRAKTVTTNSGTASAAGGSGGAGYSHNGAAGGAGYAIIIDV
jgi:hypothetical protein